MVNRTKYLAFLQNKGRALSEINPGSDERALKVKDALHLLKLLMESQTAILGGDIISEENNELIYAYQLWGYEFQYLNWYCDQKPNEKREEFLERSFFLAKEGIHNANQVADKLNKECYIVLVIE